MRLFRMNKFKKSFSLYEIVFVFVVISIIASSIIPKTEKNNAHLAAMQILNHIKLARLHAMSDNIYNDKNLTHWHKSRWTIKFMNCVSSVGGIYYVIYKDENLKGSPNKTECAIDPITKKYLYSNNNCSASSDEDSQLLLTKEYNIEKIVITCNKTTTIGQISFGFFGEPYAKLSDKSTDYLLSNNCFIEIYDAQGHRESIQIAHLSGIPSLSQ